MISIGKIKIENIVNQVNRQRKAEQSMHNKKVNINEEVPVWQQDPLEHKNVLIPLSLKCSSSNNFEFNCLPTDKVVRYKNRPDLQSFDK